MIFAELHGKLGQDYSLAHERAEDLLTSTAFQLLRYLPLQSGLLALLKCIRPVTVEGVQSPARDWIDISGVDAIEVCFWQSLGGFGIPDVILKLKSNGHEIHRVLIEVKLHSGKSGNATDEDDKEVSRHDVETSDDAKYELDSDQLAKYWQGLCRCDDIATEVPRSMVYLTSHLLPPQQDLADSLACHAMMRLGWVSWYDLWRIMNDLGCNDLSLLPAVDLAALLAHRGFATFAGFRSLPLMLTREFSFWTRRPWFSMAAPELPTETRHWYLRMKPRLSK